jgi:hypothetical protein
MDGIRLIRLLDVLSVTSMRNAPGLKPRHLIVTVNEPLDSIDQVLVNSVSSPSFVVYAEHELLVEVPSFLQRDTITEVVVLSTSPTPTKRAVIQMGTGVRMGRIRGSERLLQNFVRLLLRTTGTNVFHPYTGGSLARSVGKTADRTVASEVAIAVSTVRRQIIAAQSITPAIPPDERLLSAEVSGLSYDAEAATVYVTILLTTQDQQQRGATLVA